MSVSGSTFPDADDGDLLEGFAQVVAVEHGRVWLEPEQTSSCGACTSVGLCSIGKDALTARKLAARRFQLPADLGLKVGERVVVGVRDDALVKGAAIAYGTPLAAILICGIAGQEWGHSDAMAASGALGGLILGLIIARILAVRLSARGVLTPRFLRRVADLPVEGACNTDHG